MGYRSVWLGRSAIGAAVCLYLASGALAQEKSRSATNPLKELQSEYDVALAAWSSKYSGSRDTPSAQLIERYDAWPGWSVLERAVELGSKDASAPFAFDALKWFIVDLANAVGPVDRDYFLYDGLALTAVRKHHLANARLAELFGNCARYPTPAREALLRECSEKGTDRTLRGLACYSLAECLRNKAQLAAVWFGEKPAAADEAFDKHVVSRRSPEFVEFVRSIDRVQSVAEANTLDQRVLDEFDDVPALRELPFTLDKPSLGFLVRLAQAQAAALTIGQAAPDLVGKDLEGAERKLRDYRGKVLILHFWASWCPPCIEEINHLQKLAQQYSRDELCMLGLNYDRDRQAALKMVAEKSIGWPSLSVIDLGESVGRLAPKGSWPSVIVIDRQGVLRFHDPQGEALDQAVAGLLKE